MNACKVNYKLFRREEFEKTLQPKRPILNWTELNLEVLKEVSWLEFIPTLPRKRYSEKSQFWLFENEVEGLALYLNMFHFSRMQYEMVVIADRGCSPLIWLYFSNV